MDWRLIETQDNAAHTARVEMQADSSGHYRYVLSIRSIPSDGQGWTVAEVSHPYGWRGPCLNDAKRALHLQDASGSNLNEG